ncbi:hypothetical protein BC937DRAFT_94249 [Endogone sp. FLAS-F59071]|nr:hypothetical protein BC937DRAFT_94249 [Endogone sp. FLAS-F59071]|eukprot:RUS22981.1 hypothetical protein BC937DRAFT_94249 [Endogone sp. FLAS-F59071]
MTSSSQSNFTLQPLHNYHLTISTTMSSKQKTPSTRYQRLPSADGVLPIADTSAATTLPTTNSHATVAFVGPHRDAAPQQLLLSTSPPKPTTSYNTFAQPTSNTATTTSTTAQAPNTQTRLTKPKQPNRTTKISQKLKLFPQDDNDTATPFLAGLAGTGGIDASRIEDDDEVYNQIAQIPHGTARLEAERLNKLNRSKLPRVTAYCTASSYRMDDLVKYLQYRKTANGAAPKRFDECIYTSYSFIFPLKPPGPNQHSSFSHASNSSSPLIDVPGLDVDPIIKPFAGDEPDQEEHLPEVFFFDYGVIVIWGMTEQDEVKMLKEVAKFEEEKLSRGSELGDGTGKRLILVQKAGRPAYLKPPFDPYSTTDGDDVETEEFHFHYNASYQPRIYNDIITLKSAGNYLVKLTISHAIAQSVKMTLFERLIEDTISEMKYIPQVMAETGKVHLSSGMLSPRFNCPIVRPFPLLSRTAITQKIGQLFIMRINVNLVSNILDTPEIFWSEPALEPLYSAIRGYLEISQRVELLNQRVAVISDLLDMLKEHQISLHGEQLEWIVIVLIGFEIVIGLITIALDAFSYSHRRKGGE